MSSIDNDEKTIPIVINENQNHPTQWKNVTTFLKLFISTYWSRILLFTVFIIALNLNNAIGLLYGITTVISLVIEQKNNWRFTCVSYMLISVMVITAQIYFLTAKNQQDKVADLSSWLGLSLTFTNSIKIFVLNIVILLMSIVGLILSIWPRIVMTNEEFENAREKYKYILYAEPNKVSEDETDLIQIEETVNEQDKEQLKQEFQYVKAQYYYKRFDQIIEAIYHIHGYELSLFFLLVVAFYRLNVMSIVYILIAAYFSFSSKYFYDQARYAKDLWWLKWEWRALYLLLALDLIRQHFFLTWFPLSWNIPHLFSDEDFGCKDEAKLVYSDAYPYSTTNDYDKCILNWRSWLSLDNFSYGELIMNFINLFMFINYDKYFTAYDSFRPSEHSPGDKKDFTDPRKKGILLRLKFFYYCHFLFVPLIFLIMIGVKDNITGQTDAISCVYFFGGLYLLYNYKMLIRQRNRVWKVIETLNNLVLLIIVMFQVPIIPCPLNLPDRYYYTLDECVALQSALNSKHENTLNSINSSNIWFQIINIIGINKVPKISFESSYKEILMILFYFFAFIQRKIWNHGYTEAYVAPYYEKRDKYKYEIAAMYVEQIHLRRRIAHRTIVIDQEIAKVHERKIQDKLKDWENIFQTSFEVDETPKGSDRPDNRKDKALDIIEEIFSTVPEAKILDIDTIVPLVEKCNFEKEKILEELHKKIAQAQKDLTIEIRQIEAINLPLEIKDKKSLALIAGEEISGEVPQEEEKLKQGNIGEEEKTIEQIPYVRYTSGGFLVEERLTDKTKEPQGKENFGKKIKKFLVYLSKHSSFIYDKRTTSTSDDNILSLIAQTILMHIDKITFLVCILNHLVNVNLLSFVFPLSILFYGAVEFPVPTKRYWNIMLVYTIVVILAKFLYQLPFFCGTPPYSFNNIFAPESYDCSPYLFEQWYLSTRIDYLIGIRKFTGDSSYPLNGGLFSGIIWDLLTFFCLICVRSVLHARGVWDYMQIYQSWKFVPQLKDMPESKKAEENKDKRSDAPQGDLEVSIHQDKKQKNKVTGFKKFIRNMFAFNPYTSGPSVIRKPGHDYYVYLAPLSVIILIYFIVFFSNMIGNSRSIKQDLDRSQFSGAVVIVITIILIIMIIERALYISRENYFQVEAEVQIDEGTDKDEALEDEPKTIIMSKSFAYKIIMHYFLVIFVNVFFFTIMLNSIRQEEVNNYGSIAMGYILCSFYLFFSALQIKYGYPLSLQTHFFSSTDKVTSTLFQVYRAVPFLYEITSILDWTFIKTSLGLFEWMKLEDAYANLFVDKSEMESRKEHLPGEPIPKAKKFTSGCCLVFLLVFIIILPLLLFSSLNPSQEFNNIISGVVTLDFHALGENIKDQFTVFEVKNLGIQNVTKTEYNQLKDLSPEIKSYELGQLQKIEIPAFSENQWLISPPSLQLLTEYLKDPNIIFYISLSWKFTRPNPSDSTTTGGSNSLSLTEQNKEEILNMLQSTGKKTTTLLKSLIPKVLLLNKLPSTSLLESGGYNKEELPFNTDAMLSYVNDKDGKYWTLAKVDEDQDTSDPAVKKSEDINIILASDTAMGSMFKSLGSLGIIGFYVTVVLAVGKLIRLIFDKVSQRVIYEEMPNPDNLIELCNAIYLARKEGNLLREEKLYNTLIRIYRSPEIILELTGGKQKQD